MRDALVAFTAPWTNEGSQRRRRGKKAVFLLHPLFLVSSRSKRSATSPRRRSLRFPLATVQLRIFHPEKGPKDQTHLYCSESVMHSINS